MKAPIEVDFFFAPGSRYSYLAASQLRGLELETGCRVEWRPLHGPELRTLIGRDPFTGPPLSGQYDWTYRRRDAELWAAYYGIPFREPPSHEFDFRLLVRAAQAAKRLGAAAEYGWRIAREVYGSDTWPLDEAACLRVGAEIGLARDEFARQLSHPDTERDLSETAHDAHRRGAFGVPTFFVPRQDGSEEMFWGNDRIVLLRHTLSQPRR